MPREDFALSQFRASAGRARANRLDQGSGGGLGSERDEPHAGEASDTAGIVEGWSWGSRRGHERRGSGAGARAGARSCGHPLDRDRHPARDAARGARSDDRRDRAADDRARARRSREPALGGHRLSPELDRGDPALRQAQRHSRPPAGASDRHRHLRPRLARLRARPLDDGSDRRARLPGAGRRRPDLARPDHHRRRGRAQGARPLSGLHRRRVRHLERRRPRARRLLRRAPALVDDLLDQPAARPGRVPDDQPRAAPAAAARAPASARSARRRPDGARDRHAAPGAQLGRPALSLGLAAGRGAAARLGGGLGPVRAPPLDGARSPSCPCR